MLCALFLSVHAQAELRWDRQTVKAEAKAGDSSLVVVFSFTNAGRSPVSVLSVQPSCGCMTVEPTKTTYAPGEGGQLRVHMDLQGRTGLQEKSIAVTTDDSAAPTRLNLEVNIPAIVQIAPQGVMWNRGGPKASQEVLVTAGSDVAIDLQDVQYDHQAFVVEQVTETAGRRYKLRVTPLSTAAALQSQLTLKVEAIVGQPESHVLYLVIR